MVAARLCDKAALCGLLDKVVEVGKLPTPTVKFFGGIHNFYNLEGIIFLPVNMNAFLISLAQRLMDDIKVTFLPHVRSPYFTEGFTFEAAGAPACRLFLTP